MPSRFDADYDDAKLAFDALIDEVFSELKSGFLEMPRGEGFIDYPTFERGYQALKKASNAFANLTQDTVETAVASHPISFVVFRAILGFSPPEWAYITSELTSVSVDQGAARSIDRTLRLHPLTPRPLGSTLTDQRIRAMIEAGLKTLAAGSITTLPSTLHRLDQADTKEGVRSIQPLADLGVPYLCTANHENLRRPRRIFPSDTNPKNSATPVPPCCAFGCGHAALC